MQKQARNTSCTGTLAFAQTLARMTVFQEGSSHMYRKGMSVSVLLMHLNMMIAKRNDKSTNFKVMETVAVIRDLKGIVCEYKDVFRSRSFMEALESNMQEWRYLGLLFGKHNRLLKEAHLEWCIPFLCDGSDAILEAMVDDYLPIAMFILKDESVADHIDVGAYFTARFQIHKTLRAFRDRDGAEN